MDTRVELIHTVSNLAHALRMRLYLVEAEMIFESSDAFAIYQVSTGKQSWHPEVSSDSPELTLVSVQGGQVYGRYPFTEEQSTVNE